MEPAERLSDKRVERVLKSAGLEVPSETHELVLRYLAALRRWNRKLDLTAAKTEDELCDLFVADAATLATLLEPNQKACDVGTGAGAPGLLLALLRPDLHMTLVEPLAKRTSFMRSFWAEHAESHAPNVRILREPVDALRQRGERFEVALSRATFEPSIWLAVARDLLEPGGLAIALLAKEPTPPAPAGLQLEREHAYVWPLTSRERSLGFYRVAD